MENLDIAIVGAGAAGLMAALELSKAGRNVTILEARNRIGGRIWPVHDEFGMPAEAGAEFVHGFAEVTRSLMREAKLTYVPTDGDRFSLVEGNLVKTGEWHGGKIVWGDTPYWAVLEEKLRVLEDDMPLAEFLRRHCGGDEFRELRAAVVRLAAAYDAADPEKMSSFLARDEWFGAGWQHGYVREGYGALLHFLEKECEKNGVSVRFGEEIQEIALTRENGVDLRTKAGLMYRCRKAVVTVPLPILGALEFHPPLPERRAAVERIGFGHVIKILLLCKTKFWERAAGEYGSRMKFVFTDERIPFWWTQYPEPRPLLTGWAAGPRAEELKDATHEQIIEDALSALQNILKVDRALLLGEIMHAKVANWSNEQFSRGAYSYDMVGTQDAPAVLAQPVGNVVFFAGEALHDDSASVEGALASGLAAAQQVLTTVQ